MSLVLPDYAELHGLSNFSFLRGASHPQELVARAKQLGYQALAVTDECSLAGIVRAHVAAKEHGLKLLVGSQFVVQPDDAEQAAFTLIVLACNANGYGHLCEFITHLRRRSPKGTYHLPRSLFDDLAKAQAQLLPDCLVLASPDRASSADQLLQLARWLMTHFTGRCWLAVTLLRRLDDERWLLQLRHTSEQTAIPLVAAGDVHMHVRSRKALQDVLTATRLGRPLTQCGLSLQPNAEQHLRTRLRLAQLYPPALLAETLAVAARCDYSLDELRYQYPAEVVPDGQTPSAYLRQLTEAGAARRWPSGVPPQIVRQIEHELKLIADLGYEHYFLTVADIVRYARSQHILCQGRGSAANSVVCYCLGITEVDPSRMQTLFERFISKERNEPPDIDVDFEHERREEVIQYLYRKYGRDRAALTATVISYRPRSALRDVGKALGFAPDTLDALSHGHHWWDGDRVNAERVVEAGLSMDDTAVRQLMALATQVMGFPRHLSQHTGGFVLTRGPLSRLVPIENATMADRTVIEWDKDDLDALGLLKVDVLALGMLTALRKALDLVSVRVGHPFVLQDIPDGDEATFDMMCRADTVGVFQIESRAQMSMLPRLRPRVFYDLVIEVAIVRPGPIQGGMVHPYLNRRQGKEQVTFPNDDLRVALGRTLGVPVFQEQVMQVCILAAGFTPGEADALRRSMAAWRRTGTLARYHERIVQGMTERGYDASFANAIFEQIKGFSEYGFPESHAASFALLVYDSAWIKCHYPAEFLTAMLNSQPLGFYTDSQLVQDARRHGVSVLPVDVSVSQWDCTLERTARSAEPAVRLGLRLIKGLGHAAAQRLVNARQQSPWQSTEDLASRAELPARDMRTLAGADALASLVGHRRQQVWAAAAQHAPPPVLHYAPVNEPSLALPPAYEAEEVLIDYASTGLTLRSHPMSFLRPMLRRKRFATAADLQAVPHGRVAHHCGIVTLRQQPQTAKGVIFVSLEDETGVVQIVCWPSLSPANRRALMNARLLGVHGIWQREEESCNLIAGRLEDLTPWLGRLADVTGSRDFH